MVGIIGQMDVQPPAPQQPSLPQLPPEPTPDTGEPIIITPPEPEQKPFWKDLVSFASVVASALVVALFLITFVFQTYVVDGPSMQETLHDRDRLIVWKLPRTWARMTGNDYVPPRGEVIIFSKNDLVDSETGEAKQLVKRVIGVPGDRVEIRNGTLRIYNQENPNGYDPSIEFNDADIINPPEENIDITVDEGELFVVGDNRQNSLDSRSFGTIRVSDVVGSVGVRFFPLGDFRLF